MCLTVSERHDFQNPFTCNRDIVVFKILNRETYSSIANNANWSSNSNWYFYPTHVYRTPVMDERVEFKNNRAVLSTLKFSFECGWCGELKVNQGIHSYADYTYSSLSSHVFLAVIPAGTEFYIGVEGDIVSKKILIFETEEEFSKYKKEIENRCIYLNEFNEKKDNTYGKDY